MTNRGGNENMMMADAMKSTPTKSNNAKFQLDPEGELVDIPDELFIYSTFLREYKKSMMKDKCNSYGAEENTIIPLRPISGELVFRKHLEKLFEFFALYTRHNYGPGSSAKKASSALDVRAHHGKDEGLLEAASTGSGGAINDMEAKADAKWSKLPDWAHGWFSALDKDMLMMSANVANFLTATPFVEHFALFLAVKTCEMSDPEQIMKYLNFPAGDPEGSALMAAIYPKGDESGDDSKMEETNPKENELDSW